MKQKNLAMLGVAVGCGLVAAVAVAKLSAGSGKGPETAKVLVAKKDASLQTKLDEKNLDAYFGWADVPRNLVPPDAVTDVEQVKGKTLTRTLKTGNTLSISDVGKPLNLELPDGAHAMTVKASAETVVAGFAKPGSRVDVMYVEKMPSGKARAAIILKNMLVLALNTINVLDEKTGAAIPQVESATLAVDKNQATRLTFAEEKGRIKLLLTGTSSEEAAKKVNEGPIVWVTDPFADNPPPPKQEAPKETGPKLEKMVVTKKAIPQNLLINADNVGEYFDSADVAKAPEGVITNADDLKGKYFVKAVDEGTIVFKSLTNAKPAAVEAKKEPEKKTPVLVAEKPKFPRYEQVIQGNGAAQRVIWMEVAPNKWKRFDSAKAADEYKPEEPSKDEKKPQASEPTKTEAGE